MSDFIGRVKEVKLLQEVNEGKTASLVVISGRRRIGKSRLIQEAVKNRRSYIFTGLPPLDEITAQDQRIEFARQLKDNFNLPAIESDNWGELFTVVAKITALEKCIIVLDEISWMGSKDRKFLAELKVVWDLLFSKNSKLTLILCGSVSTWIERNIISSTGFFGRVKLHIRLKELSLSESNQLLENNGFKGSAMEKLTLLSMTGGIPWYLELVNQNESAIRNIHRLCFSENGILVDEYHRIFHDLFGKRGNIFKRIVDLLKKGPREYLEIARELNYTPSGPLSDYLDDLVMSGYISRDYVWNLKTGKERRISRYRLSDNYLLFYTRLIEQRYTNIKSGQYDEQSVNTLPGWNAVKGLQFENIILNNRKLIFSLLNINSEDVLYDNPYFQRKTARIEGCQIDYIIETRHQSLYVVEIKFNKNSLGVEIVNEIKEKIKKIVLPKGYVAIPVLIHVGGVSDSVVDKEYFYRIIDIKDCLQN